MRNRLRVVLFCLLAAAGLAAHAEVAVPPYKAHVTDLVGLLDTEQQRALERRLRALEARLGTQVAVLIIPTTESEAIEQYSIRVVDKWKLGRKKIDNGVLLLIVRDDRDMRIEVGYGLEGALPDITAKRIVADTIRPKFLSRDYYGGISDGLARIDQAIARERLPRPPGSTEPDGTDPVPTGHEQRDTALGLAVMFGWVGFVLRFFLGVLRAALWCGAIAIAVAWLFLGSFLFAAGAGVIVFIFVLCGIVFIPAFPGLGKFLGGAGGAFGGGGASITW